MALQMSANHARHCRDPAGLTISGRFVGELDHGVGLLSVSQVPGLQPPERSGDPLHRRRSPRSPRPPAFDEASIRDFVAGCRAGAVVACEPLLVAYARVAAAAVAGFDAVVVEAKPNARWSIDFVHDEFAGGRRILNIVGDVNKQGCSARARRPSAIEA